MWMDSLAFVGVLHMCKRKHQGCLCLNFPAKSPVRSPQAQTSLRATRLRLWVFCSKLYCPRDKVSCRLLPTYAVSTKSSSAPSTYHSSWNDRPKISPFANLSTWYAAWVRLSRKHPETRRYPKDPKVIYLDISGWLQKLCPFKVQSASIRWTLHVHLFCQHILPESARFLPP